MCYFSYYIAAKICSHGKSAYNLKWYQLPAEQRSYFLLIIGQSQARIRFSGLKIIYMNLWTFTQVSRFRPMSY